MNSNWIWTKTWTAAQDEEPAAVLFRKVIVLDRDVESARVQISADSRYKFYINGCLVEAGPSKGDAQIWFYDELEISKWLRKGANVLAAEVLRFPLKPGHGNQSIIGTHTPGLYIRGSITQNDGSEIPVQADESWRCQMNHSVRFLAEREGFAPLHIFEDMKAVPELWKWKQPGYDDGRWDQAVPYPKAVIRDAVSPGNLHSRTIPYMKRETGRFARVCAWRKGESKSTDWEELFAGTGTVRIPAESEWIVELDAGEEMTAYLHLGMAGGAGAQVKLLYAESYVQRDRTQRIFKADREDSVHGILEGYSDSYRAAGIGTEEEPEEYEPFWFRTFRFVQVTVKTGSEPLILRRLDYEETGYPLEIKSKINTSDPTLLDIWEISARTLRRCMQETYMDCPYYEQLQYIMDSRAQILFTYTTALDDRLARRCMDDFRRAQRYDGLLYSAYPNTRPNIIPGFSIFYIWMIHDHMMYFGDKALIRDHMPAVENILNYFGRNRTEAGYVDRIGGFYRQAPFWSFVDWAPQWKAGVPTAAAKGPLTMESLLYVIGLQKASELAAYIGKRELSEEYERTAEEVLGAVREFCTNDQGWIQDGPGVEEYSQHCQVFGILTGVLNEEQGHRILKETLAHRELYAQCTVSMAWYLFRALEKTGLYAETDACWETWRNMVRNHMTTLAESDVGPRSDCHAWGAVILYELPAAILGVRPAAPGYEEITVSPVAGYLDWACGEVITPKGLLHVEWTRLDGRFRPGRYKMRRFENGT